MESSRTERLNIEIFAQRKKINHSVVSWPAPPHTLLREVTKSKWSSTLCRWSKQVFLLLLPVLLLVRPVPALLLVLLEIIMYKRMVEFCNDYNILSPFNLILQRNGQQNQLCSVLLMMISVSMTVTNSFLVYFRYSWSSNLLDKVDYYGFRGLSYQWL